MRKIILILVLVMILNGCAQEQPLFKDEFTTTIDDINHEHSKFKQIDLDYEPYIHLDRGEGFEREELRNRVFGDQEEIPLMISSEEAIEDIEFYFKVLKHYYGGYLYFGGDERFLQAKADCLNYVNQSHTDIDTKQLNLLLLSQMNFVKDNHFTINNKRSNPAAKYFSNEEIEFEQRDGYYYHRQSQKRVINVEDDHQLKTYFHRSLNTNGEVVYYFGLVLKQFPNMYYQINYEDGSNEVISIDAKYSKKQIDYQEDLEAYIPTVQIGVMFHEYGESFELAKQFIKSANVMQEADVAILDLSNNSGGNGLLAYKWIENYVNTKVFLNSKGIMIYDGDIYDNQIINGFNTQKMSEISESVLLMPLNNDGVYKKNDGYNQFISSKTILFVIMNTNSASATEYLIDLLHNVENVVFVGTNSAGCLISDTGNVFSLPNSKFRVAFGNSLSVYDEAFYQEFRGFEPDFWLNNQDAINLIKQYVYQNLNKTHLEASSFSESIYE